MPPEESLKHLHDVQQAARRATRYASGRSREDYEADDYFRSAVERQFEIIGEALNRLLKIDPLTAELITEHRRIIGFRNVLIHGYDAVDDAITWRIIQEKLPILLGEVDALLATDVVREDGPQEQSGSDHPSGESS